MSLYDYTKDTLADIAPRGARLYGDRPALAMVGGDPLSYRELELQTRRVASLLQRRGVRKGDRVAILSENRPEWGVASLAIARAGAVAVPMLVDFSAEQVKTIVAHSGARHAFASTRLERKLDGTGISIIAMDGLCPLDAELDGFAARYEPPAVEPDDLAAIVYTSGTTGGPKGVMLTHRNYIADALSCEPIIVVNTSDVALSILPMAHAYEYTIGFLIPVMSGACVRYLDRPPSASALVPALARVRPTIVLSVPLIMEKVYRSSVKPALEKMPLYRLRLFRPLLERLAGAKLYRKFGGRIRFFGIGGAPLDPETERFLLAARWPYAIGYGLTETAPIIAASAVGRTSSRMAGPPLPGADIRIVDPKPAADDPSVMVGEIQVSGPMVGKGYYLDESRTAEAFTEDGYFRTGDLGFLDEKGRVFVRGRIKTMILGAAGENIYPEEVEAALNRSPYVQESLVYGGDTGLTALVQLKPEILDELARCAKEGALGADHAAERFGQQVGAVLRSATKGAEGAVSSVGKALASAEQAVEAAAGAILETIKKETNKNLAAFSRICAVERQDEAFEKTPTQKIKRFLYPKMRRGSRGPSSGLESQH